MGFRFKQFVIEDDDCAMKVGTDSIMLGSWIPPQKYQKVLDIGTGSGLLAIMLAQKLQGSGQITGIDIDKNAVSQANHNGLNCPWAKDLSFEHCSLQTFQPTTKFDLIVSNPPYFTPNITANQNSKKTPRPTARQTLTLTHQALLLWVADNLALDGRFYCVLPDDDALGMIKEAQCIGLFCAYSMCVRTKPNTKISRQLLEFGLNKVQQRVDSISIYNEQHQYSADYIALCKDYYFNF